MAIELKFEKSDIGSPWGFRLVGGSDVEQPVVVVKVNKNSLAEAAGLQVGDIIVRIDDTPTARLTHTEVHDLLFSAGLEFSIGIRRGEFSTTITNEVEDYSNEISGILREAVETDIINEAVRKINEVNTELNSKTAVKVIENLSGQEQIINTKPSEISYETKGTKWSTFLIKPDKPIPKPKRIVEKEKVKGEPYRVVIKKQPRRPFQAKAVQFDENVTEVELEETDERKDIEMTGHTEIETVDVELKISETEEITIDETEVDDESETDDDYERKIEEQIEESRLNSQNNFGDITSSWANINIDSSIEVASPLQEQLLNVQKQLQALSQLPSTIQVTLDAISKQLASIVEAKENSIRNDGIEDGSSSTKDEDEPITEEEILEETEETSEKAEAEMNGGLEDDSSMIEEEMEEDVIREEEIEDEGEVEVETGRDTDPYQGMTDEEREAAIKMEQMQAKKQKIMEERTPRPIQRPIILPGGRKWSNPEDAIPTFRKPKMSDDKIVETIESNLEVIVGNRKGESNCWKVPSKVAEKRINFLKYQPPPKNLDYLQRSEVYRLIHDLEPPVRGITSRPEIIPSVQDYYEATKGAAE